MPRAIAIAIVANLLGGTSYVLTKVALAGLTETTLVVVRTIVALAVLIPLTWPALADVLRASGRDRRRLLAMGVAGYALPLALASYGIRRSSATNASLLIGVEPLAVVVMGVIVLGESLAATRVAALALGTIGATMLVAGGVPFLAVAYERHVAGDLLLTASAIAWGIYTIAGKRLLDRYDAQALSAASLVVALPCLVPLAVIETVGAAHAPAPLLPALTAAVILGLAVSGLMTVLWNTALRSLDASRLAGFIFLQPLAGVVLAHLALGEPLSASALAGGVLILVGVLLLVHEERAAVMDAG
jgi:drug/metabolite transporter (DMT)-like permease